MPVCYSSPAPSGDVMECANGNRATVWTGCQDQGSVRVRCPKGYLPCNDLSTEGTGNEFSCWFDCDGHGGVKECSDEGVKEENSLFMY